MGPPGGGWTKPKAWHLVPHSTQRAQTHYLYNSHRNPQRERVSFMADNVAIEDASGEIHQATATYAAESGDIELGPLQGSPSDGSGGDPDLQTGPDQRSLANWTVSGARAYVRAIYNEYVVGGDGENQVSPTVRGATKLVVPSSLVANIVIGKGIFRDPGIGYAVFGVQIAGILFMLLGWYLESRCARLSEKLQILGQILCVICLILMQASIFN